MAVTDEHSLRAWALVVGMWYPSEFTVASEWQHNIDICDAQETNEGIEGCM